MSRGNITFSLSFVPMSSSRFKFNLLEHHNHPIITDSFSRETIFSHFCTISKERHHFASLCISFLSFICISKNFSINLEYLVSTFLRITVILELNEKILIIKTLTPPVSASLIYESILSMNCSSFRIAHFRLSFILS